MHCLLQRLRRLTVANQAGSDSKADRSPLAIVPNFGAKFLSIGMVPDCSNLQPKFGVLVYAFDSGEFVGITARVRKGVQGPLLAETRLRIILKPTRGHR